jgi:hypothetical protein
MAYIRHHYTLIKCVVIDRFRENHEIEVIAGVINIEGRIKRGAATDESGPSTE